MKPKSPPPGDESAEISVVIRALREADLRLEQLTDGEVDTVSDRDGRSFVLQRAQGQLRDAGETKQAAIINALPAQIALLDGEGIIVSANARWRRPTQDNAFQGPTFAVGCSYVDICDRARGEDAAQLREVAAGTRLILQGTSKGLSIEYHCGALTERRWFLLCVTPLADGRPGGAVVMHFDITDQKRGEESLRRFAAAMDATADAVYLVDRSSMRFVHVNEAACRMQALTRNGLLAMSPAQVFATSPEQLMQSYDALIISSVDSKPSEILRRSRGGAKLWLELRRHAQQSEQGWTIVTLVRDITERKEAERRIVHLSRVHAMLSGINTLIVRVRNREELFREACRIATEEGGFRMIWIGIVDRARMKVVPVASLGVSQEFLTFIAERFSVEKNHPLGNTMTARAIRTGKPVHANDLETNNDVLFSKEHFRNGIRSMAVFPLLIEAEVIGMVALYADESEFFHAGELKLLTELTGDIAFAMDHIDKQERLDYLAYYDVLTGLANRRLFLERAAQSIRSALSARGKLALLLIDLEGFKNINDSHGRPEGDLLLKQVADWLIQTMGDAALLARIGADHFAVILPDIKKMSDVAPVLEKTIQSFLSHPFRVNDTEFRVAAKVGVALYPDDGADADTLFTNAESALKKAKLGGNRYLCYAQKMTVSVASRLNLENRLRHALERNEFELFYQPKVSLANGALTGAEALLRWNDPQTGLVGPNQFIPILEETGLIHDVGRWALNEAIRTRQRWRAAGLPAVRIAVNVSPLQLRSREFVTEIRQALGDDAAAALGLELEITESLIMEDIRSSITSLRAIRDMGVRIAIDDFGTGFSSLRYLAKLPVHSLKIDRSFVIDMSKGPEGLSLVSTIVNLAHSLKLTVVAEGVETPEQSRLLRLLNCEEMQGFLISKPVSRAVFESKYLGATSLK
jgi:diguanylate cyclase (GGDEF)-like protein/PAS domain S-box-containing protein